MRHTLAVIASAVVVLGATPALAVGSPPNAVDDHIEGEPGTLQLYVLANDSDPDGDLDAMTLQLVSAPQHGTASVIAVGAPRIKYHSDGESEGDRITYRVCDSTGLCATATVYISFTTPETTSAAPIPPTTTSTSATGPSGPAPATQPGPAPSTTVAPPTDPAPPWAAEPGPPATHPLAAQALPREDGRPTPARIGDGEAALSAAVRSIGRSGYETVRIVAVPAALTSGFIGWLLIGSEKALLGTSLGLLGWRRRRRDEQA